MSRLRTSSSNVSTSTYIFTTWRLLPRQVKLIFVCKIFRSGVYPICGTSYRRAFAQQLLQWKNNIDYIFWLSLCSLLFSTQSACAVLYCDGSTLFFYIILLQDTIFGTNFSMLQRVFISHTVLVSNIRRIQWDIDINVHRSSCTVLVILVRF